MRRPSRWGRDSDARVDLCPTPQSVIIVVHMLIALYSRLSADLTRMKIAREIGWARLKLTERHLKKPIDYKLKLESSLSSLFLSFVNNEICAVCAERASVVWMGGIPYHAKRTPIFDFSLFFQVHYTADIFDVYSSLAVHPDSRLYIEKWKFESIWNSSSPPRRRTLVSVQVETEQQIKKHKIAKKNIINS